MDFNTTFIIRSIGERTEQLCKSLILEQGVSEVDLFIVREVPFSASLRKSYQIGIEQNKKWTFCVDADVLLRERAIENLLEFAKPYDESVCEIQGLVLDKFFSGPRQAGNRLYRTSLLEKVIKHIPEEGISIRPETYTLQQMSKIGYSHEVVPYILGIHDEEQFNYDIYRKSFVQAVKHLDRADLLVTHWKNNMDKDDDFKVALKAYSDSILNTEEVYINSDQELYKRKFKQSGFKEKKELNTDIISLDEVEDKINEWNIDDKYYDYFPNSEGLDSDKVLWLRRLKRSVEKRGFFQTILLTISQLFIKAGNVLGRRVPK
ncbi:MAG: hypothetical protein RI575_11405 [Balneolaceae bacterium]|nr:hypothetical protein [Balneolaceae bacterium]MDR9409544.1 hypothetical protein [Balneolaceae bacterium]